MRNSNYEKLCLCGILGSEVETLSTSIRAVVAEFCDLNVKWLVKNLKVGIASGVINDVGSPSEAAKTIFSSLEGGMMVVPVYGAIDHLRNVTKHLRYLYYRG